MKPINEYTLQECLEEIRPKTMEVSLPGHKRLAELADRIHELTRWIPVEARLPTIEDAYNLNVRWWIGDDGYMREAEEIDAYDSPPNNATHWQRIDKP